MSAATSTAELEFRRGPFRSLLVSRMGQAGLVMVVFMVLLVFLGPLLAPYSPTETAVGPAATGPSGQHLLGTDALGRDVLSRVLDGGRSLIILPLLAVTISYLVGSILGIAGAYYGGRVDTVIARLFDILLTFPPLLLVLVVVAGLGSSSVVIVLTVAAVFAPRAGRVCRGAAQVVCLQDYVVAAQARGERDSSVMLHEVLPNIAAPMLSDYALRITYAIVFVATLNFLGLGAQPPNPDWGLMIAENRQILPVAPLSVLAPAAAIAVLGVGLNLVAETLARSWSAEEPSGQRQVV
ncbi:MAG: ABC transporter permease [Nocardioides sp.]|uniref:ABC transporter permease n=1 Tax=Nocardioides sp. TaxID=35761 RepID=UPI0039E69179